MPNRVPKPLATPTPESWGDLVRRVTNRQGRDAVDRIHAECGEIVGSRASFLKLNRLPIAPERTQDLIRAWLILAACGYEPNSFGVPDDVLPPVYDATKLRRRLAPRLASSKLGSGEEPERAGQESLMAA